MWNIADIGTINKVEVAGSPREEGVLRCGQVDKVNVDKA
jgi:hypothetical protein